MRTTIRIRSRIHPYLFRALSSPSLLNRRVLYLTSLRHIPLARAVFHQDLSFR